MSTTTLPDYLLSRAKDRWSHKRDHSTAKTDLTILTSSEHVGVIRNGGRLGSAYAPKAIIHQFSSLIAPAQAPSWKVVEVSEQAPCLNPYQDDFLKRQEQQRVKIQHSIQKLPEKVVHLGGGHDHILPLLVALDAHEECSELLIINIDAHLDTRVDREFHSGTPFRQFDSVSTKPFKLWQVGIHSQTNALENFHPLEKGQMTCLSFDELQVHLTKQIGLLGPKSMVVLSLDADGLAAHAMEAVSAVNPLGLEPSIVVELINQLKAIPKGRLAFGIYEYNPLYDNLSNKGSKLLAFFVDQFLRD